MKRLPILLLFAIMAVMAVSCDIAVERWPLMEYQKQMIPYQKGQVICFTDAKGGTTLFTTTDIITEWHEDGTAFTKIWLQEYKVKLQSESGDMISLQVGTFSYDYYCLDNSYNRIDLTFKDLDFSPPFDCAGKFYAHADNGSQWYAYDSLSINNKVYYDVVLEENGSNNQLYYNKTYGILQVRQNGKDILTLQQ